MAAPMAAGCAPACNGGTIRFEERCVAYDSLGIGGYLDGSELGGTNPETITPASRAGRRG